MTSDNPYETPKTDLELPATPQIDLELARGAVKRSLSPILSNVYVGAAIGTLTGLVAGYALSPYFHEVKGIPASLDAILGASYGGAGGLLIGAALDIVNYLKLGEIKDD